MGLSGQKHVYLKQERKCAFQDFEKILNLKLFIAHNYVNTTKREIQIFLLYMLLVIFNFRYFFINQVFFLTTVIFISF